jgi:hypothetical protein
MKRYLLILLAVLPLLLVSCQKEEVEKINLEFGYEYFPLDIGNTWIYEADSIIYDPAVSTINIDTIHYFIRETITDTLRDNTGQLLYRIQYSERKKDQAWEPTFVYTSSIETTRAIRVENNLKFIKLVFPISVGEIWEGNAFIDPQTIVSVAGEPVQMFKDWTGYTLVQRLDRFSLQNTDYQNVIEVELSDSDNSIELRKAKEYYAENIGLIYQELMILDTQCRACCNFDRIECNNKAWTSRAERGFILRKKLLSFE